MTDEPRRISDKVLDVKLTGCVLPRTADGQPVLAGMPGTRDLFVLVFSSVEKLAETMATYEIAYDRIGMIEDGPEFLASLQPYAGIRVAYDAYKHENGRIRWTEVLPVPGGVA